MRSHRNAMHCPLSAVFLWMVEMCRDWPGCAGYQKETAGSRFLVKYTPAVAVQERVFTKKSIR